MKVVFVFLAGQFWLGLHVFMEDFMKVGSIEGDELEDDLLVNLGNVFLHVGDQR